MIIAATKIENMNYSHQRAAANSLFNKIVQDDDNSSITHTETGRPIINKMNVDISLSHKEDIVYVGLVEKPFRIGLDVEWIKSETKNKLIYDYVISKGEEKSIKKFIDENNYSKEEITRIIWSIKEAFFKCIDYKFLPRKITIKDINLNNVDIKPDALISRIISKQNLNFHEIKFIITKEYVFSYCIMKEL